MTKIISDYKSAILKGRRQQLTLTKEIVIRVERLLRETAVKVRQLYEAIPAGTGELRRRYLVEKHHELLGLLLDLHTDYGKVLGQGLLASAQAAVDRELKILMSLHSGHFEAPLMHPTQWSKLTLSNGLEIGVRFGVVAMRAVEHVIQRVYSDGLRLSQRVWNLQQHSKEGLEDTLAKALLTGQSARSLGKDLTQFLTAPGADNARYRAMRVARTEINNAYREAHAQSVIDPETHQLYKHIQAIGWRLSASHPNRDVCFRAGTTVETRTGPKPIEEIQVGEEVLTHLGRRRRVTRLYRSTHHGPLVVLTARVWRKNRTRWVVCTPNHPFLTAGGLMPAGDLHRESLVYSLPSEEIGPDTLWPAPARVMSSETLPACTEDVFNLEVEEDHTYFAGGLCVHNCDIWASDDGAGLGPGNYLPGDLPIDHAHGLCYSVSVLKDFPETAVHQTTPDADAVPIAELRYWAMKQGDAPAARALAKRIKKDFPKT